MSNFSNSKQFRKLLISILRKKKIKVTDEVLAKLVDGVLEGNPIEDGHAHEAWLTAIESLGSPFSETLQVAGKHANKRSNDPTAKKYGESSVKEDKSSTLVVISNKLPFVKKIEYGIPITVGDETGNKGKKINPVKRPPNKGPLYGKRESGAGGLLVFERGGRTIKTTVATPTETGFVAKAIEKTIKYAKSKGHNAKRRK